MRHAARAGQRRLLRLAHPDLHRHPVLQRHRRLPAALWLVRIPTAERAAPLLLTASLVTNLGLLAFFTLRFLIQVARDTFGAEAVGTCAGTDAGAADGHRLHLPVDVAHHRRLPGRPAPIHRFWPFFLFISFFPQLVAGPIVRAVEFLPQMPRPRRLRAVVAYEGAADRLRVLPEDGLRRQPRGLCRRAVGQGTREEAGTAFGLWLAFMFSGQIFADFAGYSNIAAARPTCSATACLRTSTRRTGRVVQELLGTLAHDAVALAA